MTLWVVGTIIGNEWDNIKSSGTIIESEWDDIMSSGYNNWKWVR
jgi:hypothetical protein